MLPLHSNTWWTDGEYGTRVQAVRSPSVGHLPSSATAALATLGQNLRTARLRRRWAQQEAAKRSGLNLRTYLALEAGSPGASLGVLLAALSAMGLEAQLGRVAAPSRDAGGLAEDLERLPSRGSPRRRP